MLVLKARNLCFSNSCKMPEKKQLSKGVAGQDILKVLAVADVKMATDDVETLATLTYYMLERYYRHVQMITLDATRRFGSDPVLSLFRGISMIAEGRVQEGLRELEPIKDKQVVTIAVYYALAQGNKLARSTSSNTDIISQNQNKVFQMRKNCTDSELYYTLLTAWLIGEGKDVKDLAEQLSKNFPDFKQGIILRSWIDISSDNTSLMKKGIRSLEPALDENNKDPFGYLGKAKGYSKFGKYRVVLDTLNQVVISFPKFSPGLVELMRIYLAQNAWEQVIDVSGRLLSVSSQHPEALRMQILFAIGREGKYPDGANRLGELIQVIDRFEPQNAELYLKSGQLFSRICGRNSHILNQTYTLVERCVNMRPDNAEYANELAYQLFLMRKYKDATKCYQNAMSIDETSIPSLIGLLRCQVIEYEAAKQNDMSVLNDVKDQIEFLEQVQLGPEILFLKAFQSRALGRPHKDTLSYLQQAWKKLNGQFEKSIFTTDSLIKLNPDFVMELVRELFKLSPTQPILTGQTAPPTLTISLDILETLCKVVPGLVEAGYMKAKAQFLAGDSDGALFTLKHVLQRDETYGDAHLLMALIHQHKGNHSMSGQYLETALSFNFEIRDHPLYHLIKARSLKQTGEISECIQTLKMALAIPGVKRPVSAMNKQHKKSVTLDDNDRLSIFLELVDAHNSNQEHHEAAKVMQDAMNVFQGTPEEVRVRVANADLSVSRGNIEQAISMLRAITPDQPYYLQAVEKMADIYLRHKKDKKLYASCYRDLVEQQPSAHAYLLLGDAYVSIQEPEKAIEVYEKALQTNPKEGVLASKIGQTLIKTHEYRKAIAYYETAIANGQTHLQFELVDLLLKLKQYSEAESVLHQVSTETGADLDSLMAETRRYLLLSTLHKESGRSQEQLNMLMQARDNQAKVLKRAQVEQPDGVLTQKRLAADICSRLALHATQNENNLQQAIKFYKEALVYCEDDVKIILDLARLHMQSGDLESCQQYCMHALRISPDGQDQASMMMADIMFTKKQYEDAIYHYEQLLESKPDHYEALSRLIGLLRRGGQLDRVPYFLSLAETKCGEGKTAMDVGFQYCKGMYDWHCGRPHEALQRFNLARCDAEWSEKALDGMIRICLNPDQQTLGGEVFDSLGEGGGKSEHTQSSALSTAERLVREYKSSDPFKKSILDNLVLVATKHKPNVERALANFVDICQKKKDYVPGLLGMAVAYQVLKQTPRARNQLKRISKMPWIAEEADDFEQAWLLLADVYITAGKYDMATELLKKCLEHNKSSCKAYEYMGFIYEKEQSYRDAAIHYEKAWKYSNKSNPVIGYKLAFNYLKAKRFVDAIDVSHKVLSIHPDYPRIRKEILEKARSSIRV